MLYGDTFNKLYYLEICQIQKEIVRPKSYKLRGSSLGNLRTQQVFYFQLGPRLDKKERLLGPFQGTKEKVAASQKNAQKTHYVRLNTD